MSILRPHPRWARGRGLDDEEPLLLAVAAAKDAPALPSGEGEKGPCPRREP